MPVAPRTVAVLVANPALSSILSMVLAASPSLRIRPFDSLLSLTTYMRLAPVDLIVADLDGAGTAAGAMVQALRSDKQLGRSAFQVIALAAAVDGETGAAARGAGIDEILIKPMSPKYLLERVLARLRRSPPRPLPLPRPRPRLPDNVVPLFPPPGSQPLH